MLCKSVGKWVGTESPDTVLSPVTFMLFPLLVTSPVSSSVCVFSVASSPPLPVLFLALEPANTRHIFIGFWVKIQSLVTIQVSLQVSLLPCLQSPHICPTVLVWLGSALATRLNWESEFLWLMWPVEHHIYSPPPPWLSCEKWLLSRPFCLSFERPYMLLPQLECTLAFLSCPDSPAQVLYNVSFFTPSSHLFIGPLVRVSQMGTLRTGIVLGYLRLGGCWALKLHLSLH